MAGPRMPAPREGVRAAEERDTELPPDTGVALESIAFPSTHGLLKGCEDKESWKDVGEPCGPPQWTPGAQSPITHTSGTKLRLDLALRIEGPGENPPSLAILGRGPKGLTFERKRMACPGPSRRPKTWPRLWTRD